MESREKNAFFPIAKKDEPSFNTHQKKFLCLAEKDMYLNGDFNSATAGTIEITVEKCHDKDYCESEDEIESFFQSKYLIFLNNQIRFEAL